MYPTPRQPRRAVTHPPHVDMEGFNHVPGLQADFSVPLYTKVGGGKGLDNVNAWLGTAGTVTAVHFDTYENLFAQVPPLLSATPGLTPALPHRWLSRVQVSGFKYIRLYHADETDKLYPKMHPRADAASRKKAPNTSEVRVEHPDLEAHPRFQEARYTEALVGPGDLLYIPKGTWHYIRSLTTSLSINFWF
jgi:hypothetical protein